MRRTTSEDVFVAGDDQREPGPVDVGRWGMRSVVLGRALGCVDWNDVTSPCQVALEQMKVMPGSGGRLR